MTLGSALPAEVADEGQGFNGDEVRRSRNTWRRWDRDGCGPATISSATVSNAEKVRLLNDGVIADMSREQGAGQPAVPLPGPWARWGTGFMLTSEARPFLTDASFGHDGAGGQVAFADPQHKVGFAYLTNDLQRSR